MNAKQESVLGFLDTKPIEEQDLVGKAENKEQILTKVGGNPVIDAMASPIFLTPSRLLSFALRLAWLMSLLSPLLFF